MLFRRTEPPFASKNGKRWTFTATLRPRDLQPESVDLQLRTRLLDELSIGRQCLSLSPLWNIEGLPIAVALPLLRTFNDALARVVASSDRYEGWAAVPSADVQAACAELLRAASMGLKGVVLPAPQLGSFAQARRWDPLFAMCAQKNLRLFVHPGQTASTIAALSEEPCPWHMRIGLEPQHQIGTAMLVACEGRLLAEHPGLVMQFANLGGSFPSCLERLERMAEDGAEARKARSQTLRQVIFDSASMGPRTIRYVRDLMGASRVVLGTDMPIFDPHKALVDWRGAAAS